MARKAILHGGKRDEIIDRAMRLFFEHGYDGTSVRMIMDEAGGEIGMFYHYFTSKQDLFDQVVDHFFDSYLFELEKMLCDRIDPKDFVDVFLPFYERSMEGFERLKDKMHWTIQYAMHGKTLALLVDPIKNLLGSWKKEGDKDLLARELIYGMSGILHSDSFIRMDEEKKKEMMVSFMERILG